MTIRTKLIFALLSLSILFSGCTKSTDEYNKPAIFWYTKIVESISQGTVGKADGYYSSLQGEHIGSPLLPEATMILAIAHMYYKEYILTEHFLDEYIKLYANSNEKEFAEFLKIKAKYMSLPNPRRDQVMIQDVIKEAAKFKVLYPNSDYYAQVDTIATTLYMGEAVLNESIASLYDRVDKTRSAAYYRALKPQAWIKWDEIQRADIPWYREWFEGDGTSSWYDFMIPDTKSVISRNSVIDTNSTDKGE